MLISNHDRPAGCGAFLNMSVSFGRKINGGRAEHKKQDGATSPSDIIRIIRWDRDDGVDEIGDAQEGIRQGRKENISAPHSRSATEKIDLRSTRLQVKEELDHWKRQNLKSTKIR